MGNRAPGTGSISEEPDGSFKWRLTHGKKPDGKPNVIVRRAPTLTELQAKIDEVRAQLAAGVKAGKGTPTAAAWLTEWIEARSVSAAPKTILGYRTDAGYLEPLIGHIRLDKLETSDVSRAYRVLHSGGLSASSVGHVHRTLRAALNDAKDQRKLGWNPAVAAELPADDFEFEIDPLTRTESLRVLKAARERRNASRWRVALSLGLRQGEALALQVNDIDFARRELTVKRQVQRIAWEHGCPDKTRCTHTVRDKHGKPKITRCRGVDCPQRKGPNGRNRDGIDAGLVVRPVKTKNARTIKIPPAMVPELRDQVQALQAEAKRAGTRWKAGPGGGWLYPGEFGQVRDPRRDYDDWVGLLEEAGVERVRLHGARHTAASALINAGLDPLAVNETFGWSPASKMSARYQHLADEHKAQVAEAMDAALRDDTEPRDETDGETYMISINDEDGVMTLHAAYGTRVTARYSPDTAADGQGAWVIDRHPGRMFTRNEAITALSIEARIAALGAEDAAADPHVKSWREELGL